MTKTARRLLSLPFFLLAEAVFMLGELIAGEIPP
jgi:hypothetical protein